MSRVEKRELILEITDLNNLGSGVGRMEDGRVIFIKGAVTGDRVRASVIKENKSYCIGRLEELLRPSPHRCSQPFCDAPNACGGCVYRHVDYAHERELKREYVQNAFRKAGLPDVTVLPTEGTDRVRGYRNKGQYPVTSTKSGLRVGFYATGTHKVIPCRECAIQNPSFAPICAFLCEFGDAHGWSAYDEESGRGLLRHFYLRIGESTGQIMVCIVINGDRLPYERELREELIEKFPSVVCLAVNENRENTNVILGKSYRFLHGTPYIEDVLCGLRFRIAPDSFYQVNRDGAELLYRLARERADLRGGELLMDLYCGTGTIGLSMASSAGRLIGVEIVESAVECARENALRGGVTNAEFICDDAGSREVILRATGGVRPDVVVIDPPRKGSTPELIELLASLEVPKVVYVSCDADTLARDCAIFHRVGYTVGEVTPVDMFPRTGHVESVVCLTHTFNN